IVAWHPSGKYLAVWETSQGTKLWDIEKRIRVLDLAHRGVPAKLTFNDDGSILATETLWDRRLLAWDVGNGQRFLEAPDFASQSCEPGPNGQLVFASISGDKVTVSELAAGARMSLAQLLHPPLGHWTRVSISPEGRLVAISGDEGVELWDLK